jgi:hypothetical protein
MLHLNLWENPLLTESLRLEIAIGEINRLNQELADAKRKADHYENQMAASIHSLPRSLNSGS